MPGGLYHHVMSSGEEAWQHLKRRDDPFYAALGRRCLHIGSERDLEIREGLDLEFVDTAEEAQFILNTGPAGWDDRIEDYEPLLRKAIGARSADGVRQPRSRRHARQHSSPVRRRIGQVVRGGGGPSSLARQAVSVRSTIPACGFSASTTARAILAVGDSLRTDIAGAAGAGIDSLLIAGGIHAEEFGTTGERAPDLGRVEAALRESGYDPVGVAWSLCW